MNEKNLEIIKNSAKEFLDKMGFPAEIEVSETASEGAIPEEESIDAGQNNVIVNIKTTDNSSFLIGQFGSNLQALQHILRIIVRKKTEDKVKFIVDINSYRQEKNKSIIEQAVLAAQQAITEKRAVILRPMSSYERRIVHMELSKNSQISTESVGEGENRKVVVKPASAV